MYKDNNLTINVFRKDSLVMTLASQQQPNHIPYYQCPVLLVGLSDVECRDIDDAYGLNLCIADDGNTAFGSRKSAPDDALTDVGLGELDEELGVEQGGGVSCGR